MKLLFCFFSAVLLNFCRLVSANSSNFTLDCYAPGTVLFDSHIYIGDDDKLYIANVTKTVSGIVLTNGSLKLEDGSVVGIGKNYLSLKPGSMSFQIASPFTIKGGILKLYGEDFHAVPSGEDNIYVIGSINAAAGRDDVIPFQIKATGQDGAAVADYDGTDIVSSSSVSVLGSQTFDASAASSVEKVTATGGTVSSKNGAATVFAKSSPLLALLISLIV